MSDLTTLDAPEDLKATVAAVGDWSRKNQIATAQQYEYTGQHLQQIKGALKRADEFFDPPIKQAYDLHKMLVARKRIITDPLKQAETLDKQAMLKFQQAEQAKAEAERRRLQAIADEKARKEREKAEQEAAKQRAIEDEAKAKAILARKLAEEASAAEKKRLLEQAAAADRKAAAAAAKVEAKEEEALAAVAPVIEVAPPPVKAEGISQRKTWKAEIVDQSAFFAYVFDSRRADLVLPNEKMLEAIAKGLKECAAMPGVRFYETSTIAAKGG